MTTTGMDFEFNVVFYEEDGVAVAHAVELDIVGTGTSAQNALDELIELVMIQVDFALSRNDPALVFKRAPDEIVDRGAEYGE